MTSANASSQRARRRFLQRLGLAGAATVASTLSLVKLGAAGVNEALASDRGGPDSPVAASPERRWGLLIDTARCATGCTDCVRACHAEHALTPATGGAPDASDAQWIRKLDLREHRSGDATSLPVMCQHCTDAPCVEVCPTGASFRRADGIVLVNKHTCIGCRYCMMACPFQARSFIAENLFGQLARAPRGKGTVESCTLCVHRIDAQGDQANSACAEACSAAGHHAILFGDLNDPDSPVGQALAEKQTRSLRTDLPLDTAVQYRGL